MTVNGGDVLRCTQEMHYESYGAIQNVYHLRNDGLAITDAQALSDMIQVLEALALILKTLIAALQVVDGVRVVNVTQATDVGFGSFVDPTPFTGVGLVLPTQVAGGINLVTPRLNVVGRKYFGAPIVGMIVNGGAMTAAALVIMALAGDGMTTVYNAVNSDWSFGVVASFDGVFLPFQSYSLPTMAIIQRRRRLGVGI